MREKSSQKSAKNSNLQLKVPKIVPLKGPQKRHYQEKCKKSAKNRNKSTKSAQKRAKKSSLLKKVPKKALLIALFGDQNLYGMGARLQPA